MSPESPTLPSSVNVSSLPYVVRLSVPFLRSRVRRCRDRQQRPVSGLQLQPGRKWMRPQRPSWRNQSGGEAGGEGLGPSLCGADLQGGGRADDVADGSQGKGRVRATTPTVEIRASCLRVSPRATRQIGSASQRRCVILLWPQKDRWKI